MEFERLAIPDVLLCRPTVHSDRRGRLFEIFRQEEILILGGKPIVQANFSQSEEAGVLRGLHFQAPPKDQAKLVHCVRGSIFDVAVDIRQGSPTYGKHVSCVLSAANQCQLWIPAGFAHGFCTLESKSEVTYYVTEYYSPAHDRGLAFDDPDLQLEWPFTESNLILSERDRQHPRLGALKSDFRYQLQV